MSSAPPPPPHLTPPDIRALEVGVEEDVEVEGRLLAGVVDPDVEVEFLLPQDDAVGDAELVLGPQVSHRNMDRVDLLQSIDC